MPAWEFRLSEESLWSLVAFLIALPEMPQSSFQDSNTGMDAPPCTANLQSPAVTTRARGDVLLRQYGCHSCHRIRGVVGPDTHVGPALVDWHKQKYIAGVAPNTRDNLANWIRNPRAMSPRTLMPDMEVAESHAKEMADYLLAPP
jgi:cytochrome c551/c552